MAKKSSKRSPASVVPVSPRRRPRTLFETNVEWAAQWTLPHAATIQPIDVRQATEDVLGRIFALRMIGNLHRNGRVMGPSGEVDRFEYTPQTGHYFHELQLLQFRCARIYLLLDRLRIYPLLALARAELGAHVEVVERHLLMLFIMQSGHDQPPDDEKLAAAQEVASKVEMCGRVVARLLADEWNLPNAKLETEEVKRQSRTLQSLGLTRDLLNVLQLLRRGGESRTPGAVLDAALQCSERKRGSLMRGVTQKKPPWVDSNRSGYRLTDAGRGGLQQAEAELAQPRPQA